MKRNWQISDLIAEGTSHLQRAKSALEDGDAAEAARALAIAEDRATEALRLCRHYKVTSELKALNLQAITLLLQKKYDAANAALRERLALAKERGDTLNEQATYETLGRVAVQIQDWAAAEKWYSQALRLFEDRREQMAAEEVQASYTKEGIALYDRLLQAVVNGGKGEAALAIVERAKSRALLSTMGTADLQCPSEDASLVQREAVLLEGVRATAAEWKRPGLADTRRNQSLFRWIQLRRELEQLWDELERDARCGDYVLLRRGEPPSASAIRDCLTMPRDCRVALLDYLTGQDTTYLAIHTPDLAEPLAYDLKVSPAHLQSCIRRVLIDFNQLPSGWKESEAFYSLTVRSFSELRASGVPESILSQMDSLRDERWKGRSGFTSAISSTIGEVAANQYGAMLRKCAESDLQEALKLPPRIRHDNTRHQGPAGDGPGRHLFDKDYRYEMTYLDELMEALLPSAARELISGCDLLCISPHGPLHGLPFHAMRWPDGRYLIEVFGVCYVPSAGVLKSCLHRNPARREQRPRSCLFAGVDASGSQAEGFESDDEFLKPLFNHGAHTYLALRGAAATVPRVMAEIGGYDAVHLTCHGVFSADRGKENPLESGLLFASEDYPQAPGTIREDCLLTAIALFPIRMQANLVSLRACSSGRVNVEAGDELMGLARAFFYGGTPSLLAGLWNVNSNSARRLLADFYHHWLDGDGMPKWRALQAAQIGMLQSADASWKHPYHWAPFVLMGDWI